MNETQTNQKDIICPDCGSGPFKTEQGLAGHRKIAHNIQTKTIQKDEITKRLEAVETQLASTLNPEKTIDSEEKTIAALKLLLPALEKYKISIGQLGQRSSWGWLSNEKYRVVRNSDLESAGFSNVCLKAKAKEL